MTSRTYETTPKMPNVKRCSKMQSSAAASHPTSSRRPPHVTDSSTNAFNVTMRELVDEFSELDVLTFDQRMRRILMRSTNFVDDSFVAEFVDEFVTCGGCFRYYNCIAVGWL